MDAKRLQRLQVDLGRYLDDVLTDLGRHGRRPWAELYLRGLLLDGRRKSAGAMAERLRRIDEWHVDLANPFQEIAFGFSPWFPEEPIVFRPAFSEPWFHSIRPVGHTMRGNGIQHLLV